MNKKSLLLLSTLGLLIILLVTIMWDPQSSTSHQQTLMDSPPLREAPRGGNFTVNALQGPVSLSDLTGKVAIVYFGYTLCPDICPTSLGFIASALNQLDDTERAQVQTVFISVDPERDNLEHLENYAQYFHPDIIGTTASKETIDDIVDRYGASYRMVDTSSSLGYLVDHSASIYLVDKKGMLAESLPHGTLPTEIVQQLRSLLSS